MAVNNSVHYATGKTRYINDVKEYHFQKYLSSKISMISQPHFQNIFCIFSKTTELHDNKHIDMDINIIVSWHVQSGLHKNVFIIVCSLTVF